MKFHEFGDKENQHIMLIHGGGNSWWNYLRQAKALSKEYHVILPTLDGHGEEYNTEYVSTIDSAQKLISYINQNCNGQLFLLCVSSDTLWSPLTTLYNRQLFHKKSTIISQ